MGRIENCETVLMFAVSHSKSLRTTVPSHIVKKLKLERGDHLDWDIDKEGTKWVAKLVKVENKGSGNNPENKRKLKKK